MAIKERTVGSLYGCQMNHHKDETRCSNNRLFSRNKAEGKVTELLKSVLLQPSYLEAATKRSNEIIKERLRVAPEEIKALEVKKRDAEREVQNLIKFVSVYGDASATIKDSLTSREQELKFLNDRIKTLKTANLDRLLLTSYALKARFEKLAEYFEKDPIISSAYLKQLFPSGLKCVPSRSTVKRNHNQRNSFWTIDGTMLVDEFLGLPRLTQMLSGQHSGDTLISFKI